MTPSIPVGGRRPLRAALLPVLVALTINGCSGGDGSSSGTSVQANSYQIVIQVEESGGAVLNGTPRNKALDGGGLFLVDSNNPEDIVQLADDSNGAILGFRVLTKRRAVLLNVFGVPGGDAARVSMIELDGERRRVAVAPGQLTSLLPYVSSDERWLAGPMADERGVLLIDLEDPALALEIPNPLGAGALGPLAFSHDSARLFFTVAGRLFAVPVQSPDEPQLLFDPGTDSRIGRLLPSMDGDLFVLTSDYRRGAPVDALIPAYDLFALEPSAGRVQRLGESLPGDTIISGDHAPLMWNREHEGAVTYVVSQQRVTPGEQFHAPGEVRRVRLAAPTETCLMSEGIDRGLAIRAMTESPYGDQLAYQTGEGAWRIIDLRDVDCQHPDAGPESVPLFKVSGFPYFLPDGRSVVIGNSPLYQPPDETPGLFLVNLATPGRGVAINAPLAEDELVTDYRSAGDGKTFVYASRPRRCIDSSGTQCAGPSVSGLYATHISAPGEVTTLLNAEASVGLSSWAVVPR